MKRVLVVSVLTLSLAGCTTTVYDNSYRRPVASVYVQPAPYYAGPRYVYRGPPRCYTVWERTHYGLRERRVCH
jgi:hypothetical protein